jgi:hypothetical protein
VPDFRIAVRAVFLNATNSFSTLLRVALFSSVERAEFAAEFAIFPLSSLLLQFLQQSPAFRHVNLRVLFMIL